MNPWDNWPDHVKRTILKQRSQGRSVKDISSSLGFNKNAVGAYLRSQGIETNRNSLWVPDPEEIAARAKAIKERKLADMRGK